MEQFYCRGQGLKISSSVLPLRDAILASPPRHFHFGYFAPPAKETPLKVSNSSCPDRWNLPLVSHGVIPTHAPYGASKLFPDFYNAMDSDAVTSRFTNARTVRSIGVCICRTTSLAQLQPMNKKALCVGVFSPGAFCFLLHRTHEAQERIHCLLSGLRTFAGKGIAEG